MEADMRKLWWRLTRERRRKKYLEERLEALGAAGPLWRIDFWREGMPDLLVHDTFELTDTEGHLFTITRMQ